MRIREKQSTVMILTAVAFAIATILLAHQPNSGSSPSSDSNLPGIVANTSLFGTEVGLDQARALAGFGFNTPSSLPGGTVLDRIHVSTDGSIVRLFYSNPGLPDAAAFGGSIPFPAQIVVYAEKAPTNPIPQLSGAGVPPILVQVQNVNGQAVTTYTNPQGVGGSSVSVCGTRGYGDNQTTNQAGILIWWINGVEYVITAKLSLVTLLSIGNSMC